MISCDIATPSVFCRDNLEVLRGINTESVDMIYLDPPFNKNKSFHAPVGTKAAGASFDDIWREEDVKDAWHVNIAESAGGGRYMSTSTECSAFQAGRPNTI